MEGINEIGQGIGIIGLMGFYIWFKVWMYKREWNNDKENKKEAE
jgi:hypothetical protein